ncbi:geraniol 8-hydroxylase-like [Platysternon megacephalum]|uniref:Geraniol 8-hydroxylase-like n=1 Tax=Platysternon megacephalum TaxID=55544 RepID=A0A4D9DGI9_9SAUR|nr:geraniol 8-hydroxylase-like [Platysternon megacephalum]
MAAADPAKNIKGEVTCSICLDLFKDPVTTECGHSFCTECITQHCEEKENDIVCPQCRKRFRKSNLRPNRELKNIVDSIPQLVSSERLRKPIEENMCERHGDPLKFYCKEDQTPVCMVCERSQAHRGHTVVPVEGAVQEYWETITEKLEVIESIYGKLPLLVNKDWKYLPPHAEEAHKRLKRLTDNVAILLKVDIKGQRQRFEDLPSQTQPPEPDLKNFCPGKKIAVETELHKERENIRERMSEKQETASHVIRIYEEAPTPKYGLDHASLDPVIHNISNTTEDIHHKVDVKGCRERSEEPTSLKAAVECGESRKDSASPGRDIATQTELEGHEEKGGEMQMEQKETKTHVCEEAETPRPVPRRKHQGWRYYSIGVIRELKKVDVKGCRERFEDLTSLKAAVESGESRKDSASPGRNVTAQTELRGREEEGGETQLEQKETKTHVCEEAETPRPVPRRMHQGQRYSSIGVIRELKKVDVKSLRRRFEDLMSPNPSVESGVRRKKSASSGGNVALQTELWECKERENIREQVGEKQETASHVIRICEEAPTPKYGLDHASLDPIIHKISNTTEDIHHHKVQINNSV